MRSRLLHCYQRKTNSTVSIQITSLQTYEKFLTLSCILLRYFPADDFMAKRGYRTISTEDDEEKFSFASLLLFRWMNVVFKTGTERALEQHDFLPLSKANSTCLLTEQLQTNWRQERTTGCKTNGKKPSLWKSVVKMVSIKDIFILVFTTFLFTVSRLLQPLLLGYLVSTLMAAESQQRYPLYVCAMAMYLNAFLGSLAIHQFDYRCEVLAIRISSALKGLVYLKTLLLSKNSLLEFSTGRIIDLISNDVQRLEQEVVKLIFLEFAGLPEIVVVSLLLVYFIGWQALMGVFFLCLLVPYFAGLSFVSAELRLRTAVVSDRRISLMNQVVSGIRAIKTHAWEDGYREKIRHVRRNEINVIRKKSTILSGVAGLEYSSVPLATLVVVITLVLTGHTLTPVRVFMLLCFINRLRQCTCYYLAYGFLETYEAYASLSRIEQFLLSENLQGILSSPREAAVNTERNTTKLLSGPAKHPKKTEEVSISDETRARENPTTLAVSSLTCRKLKREDKFILENIELNEVAQSLTVITGPVGSGKSTLLSAIAGEISITSGNIACKGTLVYVPQTAWVFSGTIRENVLFGKPYDEPKYTRVMDVCALTEDIKRLPEYDQTVVGERGEVLSGGQRARVSLARAVYSDADIYLLDDPLSAVDLKVGKHIFEKCIKEFLGDKTRVLVSHQEQHMKEADEVVVLYRGRVLEKGSFAELREHGILNKTVDPLYKNVPEEENSKGFVWENETESDVADNYDRLAPLPNEAKSLQISDEDRTIGVVSFQLYWSYFRSGAQILTIFAIISLCVITQAMIVSPDVWLSFLTRKSPDDQKDKTNLAIYGCLVGASFVFAILRAYGFLLVSLRCSERLHDKMVVAILQAPVLFFDSNPVGRILNRFSKDIGCADELLPKTFLFSIQLLLLVFASIVVPVFTNPWLVLVVVPTFVAVVYISRYYLRTARELKRLESICRSPVFSHLSETLNGLDTIRTRGRQRDFVDQFYRYQDVHTQSTIMVMASGRWLGVRLDLLASLLIGSVALAAVVMSQDAASAGLALVYAVQTVSQTQYATRKASDVENLMTSVERVMTYTELDPEPGYKAKRLPPDHWPSEGNITFQDVSLIYYPGGPQVLKRINLNIKAGAKVGVVGRTGAGKSSFVAALMRMPDAEGEILVDGIRIKEINLQKARRCISVLGQSPVLFSGSLRKNLDLLGQFQDVDLWRTLENVQLKELVESFEGQLDHELLEHGANVSVGERQLVCLARVLLQRSKIVIMDEPTSHVDPQTEQIIWNVVREKLKESTVITIAHRLNTIKDCDMILVLKNGEVDEFDRFDSLMNIEDRT